MTSSTLQEPPLKQASAWGAEAGDCSQAEPHWQLATALLTALLVAVLTGLALWVRVDGLPGWDGTLTVDESRLALAARGVLETGLPRLPSGWIYTRGLLATYLSAPSLAALGATDFAARLPAVLAGAALIPVAYLLGREVAGRLGGLFVAAILAGHPSFVVWSRQAWFYALYVLLVATALLFMVRASRTGRCRDQILAGVLVSLSAFAHEVGLFLLLPLSVQVVISVRQHRNRPRGWIAPVASLAIVGIAAIFLWMLITRLRAESMVGAYGEIDEYLSPSVEWARIRFYLRTLLDGPGLMLMAALAGLPLAIQQRRTDTLLLWLSLAPTFLHASLLIPRGPQERYGLVLVLVIAVLAAQGVWLMARYVAGPWLLAAWERSHPFAALRACPEPAEGAGSDRTNLRSEGLRSQEGAEAQAAILIAGTVFVVMLLAHQDVARAVDRAALSPRDGSWLREVRALGIGPDDVVMSDVPTIVEWYVGGLDFWISSREYEKYTTRSGDVPHDVHTGAILVRGRGDIERLVSRGLAGQEIWLIASGRSFQWGELVDDDLKAAIERSASRRINPGDNFRILLIDAPAGS
jgi:hypothetical protein